MQAASAEIKIVGPSGDPSKAYGSVSLVLGGPEGGASYGLTAEEAEAILRGAAAGIASSLPEGKGSVGTLTFEEVVAI